MVLRIETAVVHSVGGRTYNEDAWGEAARDGTTCWVVCDGAGGHGGGDVASQLAVQHALQAWTDTSQHHHGASRRVALREREGASGALHDAVVAADRAVHDGQRLGSEVADMRTTIAMLSLDLQERSAAWAHVGDTRVYRFRQGLMCEHTRDHSLVEQLLRAGLVEGDPSRSHPRRNVLTAALGGGMAAGSAQFACLPGGLQAGDAFLLCTDGFWEYVLEGEMEQVLREHLTAAATLAALEQRLRARARSGNDNYTAVLIELVE